MTDYVNPYTAPKSPLASADKVRNTSGMGKGHPIPDGVTGWSWGAFMLNWLWCLFNKTYIGLLALVPYIGFFVAIYLGIKGREYAWQNKRWDSVEHFNRVQRRWSFWGIAIILIPVMVGILAAIILPAMHHN